MNSHAVATRDHESEAERPGTTRRRARRAFRPVADALESRALLAGNAFSAGRFNGVDPTAAVTQLYMAARALSLQLAPSYAYDNGTLNYNLQPGLTQRRVAGILRLEAQLVKAEVREAALGNPSDPNFVYAVDAFAYYNSIVVFVASQASNSLRGHGPAVNPGNGPAHTGHPGGDPLAHLLTGRPD